MIYLPLELQIEKRPSYWGGMGIRSMAAGRVGEELTSEAQLIAERTNCQWHICYLKVYHHAPVDNPYFLYLPHQHHQLGTKYLDD